MTQLTNLGENETIARLARTLGRPGPGIIGIGDDTAVVPVSGDAKTQQLLTSDAVIEGLHYFPGTDPKRVGRKAINRVISDIAAMGGTPRWVLVNVVAPNHLEVEWLDQVYEGMAHAAGAFDATIVGGDLTPGKTLELHVFGTGDVPAGQAVLRSGAKPSEIIVVTGKLGGSLAGKHLDFTPRVAEGKFLRHWATSMMDLSDGLALDLQRLCKQSKVGAIIEIPALPINEAVQADATTPASPWQHALFDGEDYELLFTLPTQDWAEFSAAWELSFDLPCRRVGHITADPGQIILRDVNEKESRLHEGMLKDFARHAFE